MFPFCSRANLFPLTKGLVRDDGRGEGAGFQFLLLKAWAVSPSGLPV